MDIIGNVVNPTTTEAAYAATNARLDNIIANSISTNNNTELVDIRHAADGVTYALAGTAVRAQIGNLNEANEEIRATLSDVSTELKAVRVDSSGNVHGTARQSIQSDISDLKNQIDALETSVNTLNQHGLDISDTVIQNQVDDWLEDHPEATTTVTDGSITDSKFNINSPRAVYASQIGFGNDPATNTTAFRNFLRSSQTGTISPYDTLILDGNYNINTAEVQPDHDITIIGNGRSLTINSVSGGYGIITANSHSITFYGVKFKANGNIAEPNKANIINAQNGYTSRIGTIKFIDCEFISNPSNNFNPGALWSNPEHCVFVADTVNYGINSLVIDNCRIEKNKNIIVTTYDMPINVTIQNCKVKNLKSRIITVGVHSPEDEDFITRANDIGYTTTDKQRDLNKSFRDKVNLYVFNNNVECDELIQNSPAQYYCFVWIKGNNAIAKNNVVKNLAVDVATKGDNTTPCEVFDMYLLANNVIYENNIVENVYNFSFGNSGITNGIITDAHSASILPNIKMYTGTKIIANNIFILRKDFLQRWLSSVNKTLGQLLPPPFVNLYANGDRVIIENNFIDTYLMCATRKKERRSDKYISISNNTINVTKFGVNSDCQMELIRTIQGKYNISNNTINIVSMVSPFALIQGHIDDQGHTVDAVYECSIINNCVKIETTKNPFAISKIGEVQNSNISNNNITILNTTQGATVYDCEQYETEDNTTVINDGGMTNCHIDNNIFNVNPSATDQIVTLPFFREKPRMIYGDISMGLSENGKPLSPYFHTTVGDRMINCKLKLQTVLYGNTFKLFLPDVNTQITQNFTYIVYINSTLQKLKMNNNTTCAIFSIISDQNENYILKFYKSDGTVGSFTSTQLSEGGISNAVLCDNNRKVSALMVDAEDKSIRKISSILSSVDEFNIEIITLKGDYVT